VLVEHGDADDSTLTVARGVRVVARLKLVEPVTVKQVDAESDGVPLAQSELTEVADGTGAGATRHADAVALQCWPSRGLGLDGFELKASRGDLVRELRDEKKAKAIQRYCRRWWLVLADEGLMDGLEVPTTWGVLFLPKFPAKTKLVVGRQAPQLTPEPWPTDFQAALVRHAFEQRPEKAEAEARHAADWATAQEVAKELLGKDLERAKFELEDLQRRVAIFDRASGGHLKHASVEWAEALGRAARVGMAGGERELKAMQRVARELRKAADDVDEAANAYATRELPEIAPTDAHSPFDEKGELRPAWAVCRRPDGWQGSPAEQAVLERGEVRHWNRGQHLNGKAVTACGKSPLDEKGELASSTIREPKPPWVTCEECTAISKVDPRYPLREAWWPQPELGPT
jgi:hypothetical protein